MLMTLILIICVIAVAVVLVNRIEIMSSRIDDLTLRVDNLTAPSEHNQVDNETDGTLSQEQIEEAYKRAGL